MKLLKNIFKYFLIIFTTLIITELVSGFYFNHLKLDCSYLLCDSNFKFHSEFIYNKDEKYIYKRNSYGFRDNSDNLDKKFVVLGGSTTDQRHLKLEDTWVHRLNKKFSNKSNNNLKFLNSGIQGQSLNGHIWNFEKWYPKINNFNNKIYIIYAGINEIDSFFKIDPKFNEEKSENINFENQNFVKEFLKNNNGVIIKLFRVIKDKFIESKISMNVDYTRRESDYVPNIEIYEPSKNFVNSLNSKLEKILAHSKVNNSELIFVTQRTLRWKKDDKVYSYNNYDWYNREKFVSEIIINFCKSHQLVCFDGFNELDLKEEDSMDKVHLNINGSEKVAKFIFKKLANHYQ